MATNDMAVAVAAKSDQLNADEIMGAPITVTITGAKVDSSQEQPVSLELEGWSGKPYKPGRSMSRVLVAAWGADSSKYVGQRLTLYRDPDVRFGGIMVGGIRISHMSGLSSALHVPLTVTRGRKAVFTVQPLPDTPTRPVAAPSGVDDATIESADVDGLRALWGHATSAQQQRIRERVTELQAGESA